MFNFMKRVYQNKNSILRLCNTTISNEPRKSELLYDETKFSSDQQTTILRALNESSLEELYKFDASKARLNKIEHWRTKKGPFTLLSDVLEVEGFGIKVFEKLCFSILNNVVNTHNLPYKIEASNHRKVVVTPKIDRDVANRIGNAVSIHLTPIGLSCCKLLRQGNSIEFWNLYDFAHISKKLTTGDLVNLAINIMNKIPPADAYVFETPIQPSPQAKQKLMVSTSHVQQIELTAMLAALLNTSPTHNANFKFDRDPKLPWLDAQTYNKVYFLRPFLSARLFGTLVGNEMVSAIATIESLLKLKVREKDYPCSEVGCSKDFQEYYFSQISLNKHLLGQSLLAIISFMDICIYNNPVSVSTIMNKQKR